MTTVESNQAVFFFLVSKVKTVHVFNLLHIIGGLGHSGSHPSINYSRSNLYSRGRKFEESCTRISHIYMMDDDVFKMSAQLGTTEPGSKPPCKYGSKCYRKNPTHFVQFSHPGKCAKMKVIAGKGSLSLQEDHQDYPTDSVELKDERRDPVAVEAEDEDIRPPSPKRLKVDQDDVIVLDHPSERPEARHRPPVVVLDDDHDDSEVRPKPESRKEKAAEAASLETAKSAPSQSLGQVSCPLFYLTKVRGISAHHNRPGLAIGIKGNSFIFFSHCVSHGALFVLFKKFCLWENLWPQLR